MLYLNIWARTIKTICMSSLHWRNYGKNTINDLYCAWERDLFMGTAAFLHLVTQLFLTKILWNSFKYQSFILDVLF